jgi:YD repeat-containing protein
MNHSKSDSGTMNTITEYDEKGNMIHHRNSNGYEEWAEYDTNNNLIHYRDSNGYELWREYDEKGNMIHSRNSDNVDYLDYSVTTPRYAGHWHHGNTSFAMMKKPRWLTRVMMRLVFETTWKDNKEVHGI